MIELYSGTPGSGKSLHLAERLYWRLKAGKYTVCNFDVYVNYKKIKAKRFYDAFLCVDNETLTPQLLMEHSGSLFKGKRPKEGSILLVIDEAQLLFNSRDWGRRDRNAWLMFFSQHRKFGYDVILVAQFDRMLDRQIRSLIEYELIHRKVSNYGKKGKILSAFALGNLFVSVKVWYPMKEKVGSSFFRMKRKYYSLYDTFKVFSGEACQDSLQ